MRHTAPPNGPVHDPDLPAVSMNNEIRCDGDVRSDRHVLLLEVPAVGTDRLAILLGWLAEIVATGEEFLGAEVISGPLLGMEIITARY